MMKDYTWFFILFTMLELMVTAAYILLAKTISLTLVFGAMLYGCGMYCAFLAYRSAHYQHQRKKMIENLL